MELTEMFKAKTPEEQAKYRKLLVKRYQEAKDYSELVNTKGWKRFATRWKEAAEETGRAAVFPMIKNDLLVDKLTRANQSLKMIEEVELLSSRKEELYERFRQIKNIK